MEFKPSQVYQEHVFYFTRKRVTASTTMYLATVRPTQGILSMYRKSLINPPLITFVFPDLRVILTNIIQMLRAHCFSHIAVFTAAVYCKEKDGVKCGFNSFHITRETSGAYNKKC